MVHEAGERYLDSIRLAVESREYDALMLTPRRHSFYDCDVLRRYYRQTSTLAVDVPQMDMEWGSEIWVPFAP
jgi:hypothetical protein